MYKIKAHSDIKGQFVDTLHPTGTFMECLAIVHGFQICSWQIVNTANGAVVAAGRPDKRGK